MTIDTLPSLLQAQASLRGSQVAIRHKQLGIWQEKQWQELHSEVRAAANTLRSRGFGAGDQLVLLSHPRPQALLLAIAAQWLGGVAAPLDLLADPQQTLALLRQLQPDFVFAEGKEEVELLSTAGLQPTLVLYADARGLAGDVFDGLLQEGLLEYGAAVQAIADVTPVPLARATDQAIDIPLARATDVPLARATDIAFAFYRIDTAGLVDSAGFAQAATADLSAANLPTYSQPQLQHISHHELLSEGRRLVEREHLTHQEQALAARAFAASGHARYLLAPWLLAGFSLNFPENLATRDNDRRELGPTLVAGTRLTYQRLELMVQERLPQAGTWRRKWVDRVLQNTANGQANAANSSKLSSSKLSSSKFAKPNVLDYWLVIRPLRDVIGFSRARVPLVVGADLSASSQRFFQALGINVRNWEEQAYWQTLPVHEKSELPKSEQERREQAKAGSASHTAAADYSSADFSDIALTSSTARVRA